MKPVIEVENLGKQYRIGELEKYTRSSREHFRDVLLSPLKNFRKLRDLTRFEDREGTDIIWALRDVSFKVDKGDIVGIIGSNGAGKSTLLKILTRITEPSTGKAVLRGRVGSLLEVGTGFHPEMTGRENIYLNGTILGMRKWEIDKKFDEIVAFSEVEKFLDTPVKRYSSGMYVRLAFAVAAHLESEILLVDEVLAVGDVSFQQKCLGKMGDISKQGRTVLFVSHNMAAVEQLCNKVCNIEKGSIVNYGASNVVVGEYISSFSKEHTLSANLDDSVVRLDGMEPVLKHVALSCDDSKDGSLIRTGSSISIDISYDTGDREIDTFQIGFNTITGTRVTTVAHHLSDDYSGLKIKGKGRIRCTIDELPLNTGLYYLILAAGTLQPFANVDFVDKAITFEVTNKSVSKSGYTLQAFQGTWVIGSSWAEVE